MKSLGREESERRGREEDGEPAEELGTQCGENPDTGGWEGHGSWGRMGSGRWGGLLDTTGAVYKSGGGVAFGLAHRKGVGNHDIHAFIHEL